MTLKEALESGRPFRRPGWDAGCYAVTITGDCHFLPGGIGPVEKEDILADDWVLEKVKVKKWRWACWDESGAWITDYLTERDAKNKNSRTLVGRIEETLLEVEE